MASIVENFIVTKRHMEIFNEASMDTNPLHSDSMYASRTNFGSPVAYGISTLLISLSKWANGRKFSIEKAKINFRKPIFIEEEYELHIHDDLQGKVTLEIFKGTTIHSKYSIDYTLEDFLPVNSSEINIQRETTDISYKLDPEHLKKLIAAFSFKENQFPLSQLSFLLWSSYYVGMINPGKQALFSQLNFTVSGNSLTGIKVLTEQMHPVFKTTTIEATAEGFSNNIVIKALNRPENIEYSIEDLIKLQTNFKELKGKTVLVTGGNRGFGSIVAKLFALSGANVISLYRSNTDQMKHVEEEIKKHKCNITSFKIDLSETSGVLEFKKIAQEKNYKFDYVFNNAAPTISPILFADQTNDNFTKEFLKFFQIGVNTLSSSVSLMQTGGVFVNISSSYVVTPVPEFSHYVSAKLAFEGVVNSISKEFPSLIFITYRLPKILTDQTNLAFLKENPKNPVDVALQLIGDLINRKSSESSNCETINLF